MTSSPPSPRFVIPFSESAQGLGSIVGGKGSNLIALTAAGFPVPPGCVVTAAAYSEYISSLDWLEADIGAFDYTQPDRLRSQCEALRAKMLTSPLPSHVSQAIAEALSQMNQGPDAAFAVRSSSTFEDLASAAFAGQHDTYLGIRGVNSITERVRDCFASLWEDRAVLYRHHLGFSQKEARMAVVIQRQIDCEVAGVGFSIDPVTGHMDRSVIDANFGLGESVVSGECEVDHFEIDRATSALAGQTIGHKTQQVIATASGTTHSKVPAHLTDTPCLSATQISEITVLMHQAEVHYGWPQDIEWGWRDGRLFMFQSRPVTTIPPQWTRDESAERFPRPMSPLSWDFITVAFRGSLTHSLSLMGYPPLKGDWFSMFDNYVYGNQNAVRLLGMSRPIKSRSAAELAAELPEIRQRFGWVLDLPVNWARDLNRYLLNIGRLNAAAEPRNLADAWTLVQDVLQVASEYFQPNIAISMTQSGLHRLLHGLVSTIVGPDRALPLVDGLLAGCETKTAVVNRELHELSALARDSPALAAQLADGGRSFYDRGAFASFPTFAARFNRFLEDHGHRETDMDHMQPTWSGQPWIVLDSVALILRGRADENPALTMRAQRVRYSETEQQFLAAVPADLRFFFRELIRMARTYTMLDDLEHYQTTRINPVARKAALSLGAQLVQLRALADPIDVFFLNKSDIETFVAQPSATLAPLILRKAAANKAAYLAAFNITPPWSLSDSINSPNPATASLANILKGVPGSSGRATGPCFIVNGPEDFKNFPPKAILVARTTNPAWTPLFYAAAGVITESGGALSHGAVTAREMRLPAVMSVRGVMSILHNGQLVTVDGSAGSVLLDP